MDQKITILEGYSDLEKGAYLGAVAAIAMADHTATEEEVSYIEALCESANLSAEQSSLIKEAASTEVSDDDLKRCLDVLKTSELRFSLVSDIIAFAEADETYSEEEKKYVEKIAAYLGLNQQQVSLLNQFTKKAVQEVPKQAEALENEQTTQTSFLDSLGFGDKLKGAGINTNALLKGALGIMGPILLARMFSSRRRGSGMGGMFGGGMSGGMLGGSGGILGGLLGAGLGGGLLGGLLGGNRSGGTGFSGAGGMLGRIFGNRSW